MVRRVFPLVQECCEQAWKLPGFMPSNNICLSVVLSRIDIYIYIYALTILFYHFSLDHIDTDIYLYSLSLIYTHIG